MSEHLTEALKLVIENNIGSTSLLCRKLKITFNEASEIIELLESKGIVSEFKGSKPRKVLIKDFEKVNELLTKDKLL